MTRSTESSPFRSTRLTSKPSTTPWWRARPDSVALVRSDGLLLVRVPAAPPAGERMLPRNGRRPDGRDRGRNPRTGTFSQRGSVDGIERIYSYRRIGDYPRLRDIWAVVRHGVGGVAAQHAGLRAGLPDGVGLLMRRCAGAPARPARIRSRRAATRGDGPAHGRRRKPIVPRTSSSRRWDTSCAIRFPPFPRAPRSCAAPHPATSTPPGPSTSSDARSSTCGGSSTTCWTSRAASTER